MPDSGKFKDLYLNSAHTYPCQGGLTGVGKNEIIATNLPATSGFRPTPE